TTTWSGHVFSLDSAPSSPHAVAEEFARPRPGAITTFPATARFQRNACGPPPSSGNRSSAVVVGTNTPSLETAARPNNSPCPTTPPPGRPPPHPPRPAERSKQTTLLPTAYNRSPCTPTTVSGFFNSASGTLAVTFPET